MNSRVFSVLMLALSSFNLGLYAGRMIEAYCRSKTTQAEVQAEAEATRIPEESPK